MHFTHNTLNHTLTNETVPQTQRKLREKNRERMSLMNLKNFIQLNWKLQKHYYEQLTPQMITM